MTNGLLSIRKRQIKAQEVAENATNSITQRGGSFSHFNRHSSVPDKDAMKITHLKSKKLSQADKLLKSFKYSEALDSVLTKPVDPVVVVSLFDELAYRSTTVLALSKRDQESLQPVLQFIQKYICDSRFSSRLIEVSNVILGIYH